MAMVLLEEGGWFDPDKSTVLHKWNWFDDQKNYYRDLRLFRTAKGTLVLKYPKGGRFVSGVALHIDWADREVDALTACRYMAQHDADIPARKLFPKEFAELSGEER